MTLALALIVVFAASWPCPANNVCRCVDEMEIVSETEEAGNYHQILEFFEMCANLITTLAR